MSSPGSDRLSWGDALFLYLERDGMPVARVIPYVPSPDAASEGRIIGHIEEE